MIEVPMKSIPRMLIDEILNPFYIFQVFSIGLWAYDDYRTYAIVIGSLSIFGIYSNLTDIRNGIRNIQKLARYECDIAVHRGSKDANDFDAPIIIKSS